MNKHKKKAVFFIGLVIIFLGLITLFKFYYEDYPQKVKVSIEVKSDKEDQYSIYYDVKGNQEWDEENCDKESYTKVGEYQKLTFMVPVNTENIRLDLGSVTKQIEIKNVNFTKKETKELSCEEVIDLIDTTKDIDEINNEDNIIKISYNNRKSNIIDNEKLKDILDINTSTQEIDINEGSINIKYNDGKTEFIDLEKINMLVSDIKNIESITINKGYIEIISLADDPYILIGDFQKIASSVEGSPIYVDIIAILLSLLLGFITVKSLKEFKSSVRFVKMALNNKKLIWNLAKNDFKQKYVSSYLGVVWGFIQPLITIVVYWFVFQVGFRSADVGNLPFIVWFVSGIIPWFFFSEALSSCTNVFIEYSYLVKKVVFRIETLPVIKIISTLFVHCFFILFLVCVSSVYKYYPDIYVLQVVYYLFAMIVLVFSITIFTSAVVLFFRDLGQIVNIIINVGFWATPIGWNITMLPDFLQKLFKLNPVFYIVTGYRDAFVEKIFFWQRPYHTLYFWCFCLVMLLISVRVFNKLRPHFSDVI